jgi:pyruvate/2-oxoglutarate dehydrogenase complex dihydrolipoamide dehydrogenase (E3) component
MPDLLEPDLCVVGAGAAGLSVAAGAAQMGARVVLIERSEQMGGECLHVGCVPSKALLAAARAAETVRAAQRFGTSTDGSAVNFRTVHDYVHGVIAGIQPVDSRERYASLGVNAIQASASFTSPRELVTDRGHVIRPRRVVVATGSRPVVPPIEGLDRTPYLTNDTIFDLLERPEHLIIIGGGPIGVEMAQAHRRLGSRATVLESGTILTRDDAEAVDVVRQVLVAEGIAVREGAKVARVAPLDGGVVVTVSSGEGEEILKGSHLLISTGRAPVVNTLELDRGDVAHDERRGVATNDYLQSVSNKRVYAAGDVATPFKFTHIGSYHASIIIRNVLFRLPTKVDYRAVPWVTYTDPELAHVGLTEAAAREEEHAVEVLKVEFAEMDRARAENRTEGFAKVVLGRRGRVLGATIVGAHAGELIQTWVLAVAGKLTIGGRRPDDCPLSDFRRDQQACGGAILCPPALHATDGADCAGAFPVRVIRRRGSRKFSGRPLH